jgi:hypothetical protein
MEISNNTLLNFPEELLFGIFKHSGIREREKSLCLVCKLFHVIIETRLSQHTVLCVFPDKMYESYQKKRNIFSKLFWVHHESLLNGIKVDKITFLTKNQFLHFCKNPQLLIPMRYILKLDGFDIYEICELLMMIARHFMMPRNSMMPRNYFHITILSLGQGSQLSSDRSWKGQLVSSATFTEVCKKALPYLKGLSFTSFKICETKLWDFSGLPLKKFNMFRMTCYPGLRIRMPCGLRELYIKYQQVRFPKMKPNPNFGMELQQEWINSAKYYSNVGILLNDCHKLDKW